MKQQTNTPILKLQGVSFRYPDGSVGLDSCCLSFEQGSRSVVLGVNGAGKTTLFLHLNGILRPQSGTVIYKGSPLDYGRQGLHELRSRIGLVFQNPDSQLFSASVREDVSFGPLNLGLENREVRERVQDSLQAVGLLDHADKPVHNLSFGQKKRVCIAGVLAMQPEVLILDEPMAGLDFAMQVELSHILDKLHDQGMTIIIATHDIDFAYQWADSITILAKGRCAATWSTERIADSLELFASYGLGIPRVAELHNTLLAGGLLDRGKPSPKSHQDLLRKISTMIPGNN
jgi:cobalt/nickel transport system ATP-binding protein